MPSPLCDVCVECPTTHSQAYLCWYGPLTPKTTSIYIKSNKQPKSYLCLHDQYHLRIWFYCCILHLSNLPFSNRPFSNQYLSNQHLFSLVRFCSVVNPHYFAMNLSNYSLSSCCWSFFKQHFLYNFLVPQWQGAFLSFSFTILLNSS